MNIRLYNAQILTMEQDVPVFQGEIWVENNIILSVIRTDKALNGSDSAQPSVIWDREIDCKGNLLMPGFKDAGALCISHGSKNNRGRYLSFDQAGNFGIPDFRYYFHF